MFNCYIEKAMRTNSGTVGSYGTHNDLLHGALLLADELIELRQALDKCDRTNALEEIGDICWSVALIANCIHHDPFDIEIRGWSDTPLEDIESGIGNIISYIKRNYAYGKSLPDNIDFSLDALIESCAFMARKLGSSLSDVLQLNINKLSARYPDKFTPEQANNRNTERERQVLEENT